MGSRSRHGLGSPDFDRDRIRTRTRTRTADRDLLAWHRRGRLWSPVAGPFFVIRKQLPTKTAYLAFGLLAFGLLPWLFIQAACAGCHLLRMVPMAIGL